MPITAKLSRQFYEKLGAEVANELATWLNAVDTSCRDEFRGLFEANFGRAEARTAQQSAELRSEMARMETRLIRWMFGFWIGAWITITRTILAVQRLH
jgi:hypothetical protein